MSKINFELCDFRVSDKVDSYACVTQVMHRLEFEITEDEKRQFAKDVLFSEEYDDVYDLSYSNSLTDYVSEDKATEFLNKVAQVLTSTLNKDEYRLVVLWHLSCSGSSIARSNLIRSLRNVANFPGDLQQKDIDKVKQRIDDWVAIDRAEIHAANVETRDEIEEEVNAYFNKKTPSNSVIVCEEIGDTGNSEGQNLKRRYSSIINRPLPVLGGNLKVKVLYETLLGKFPWAKEAILRLCGELAVSQKVNRNGIIRIPPLLLVGSPGSGKTKFSSVVAEVLGIPSLLVPLAGTHDSGGLMPIARGWATTRAAGPVNFMMIKEIANPIIILDELDKATGTAGSVNNNNGSVAGALLSMMNGDGKYFDTCLQTNVDLSYVGFIATANDVSKIPDALMDRFFVVKIPSPTSKYFDEIMNGVIENEAKRLDCNVDDLPKLTANELEDFKNMLDDTSLSIRGIQRAYRITIGKRFLYQELPELNTLDALMS